MWRGFQNKFLLLFSNSIASFLWVKIDRQTVLCVVELQPTWSTLDSFTTDQYTWSSSAPTAAAHDMNFRSSNCLFLNLAFWRQFSSGGKLPWGQQHFLELLLLLLGKNRWGWQDASPVQFSFDGLDKKRIFHHHMAESIHLWSQLHPKYYPVKRAGFFLPSYETIASFPLLV